MPGPEPKIPSHPFGARLELLRRDRGFPSQAAFARKIGVEPNTYSNWLKGENGEPNMHHLRAIRRLTGVDLNFLIAGDMPTAAPREAGWDEDRAPNYGLSAKSPGLHDTPADYAQPGRHRQTKQGRPGR